MRIRQRFTFLEFLDEEDVQPSLRRSWSLPWSLAPCPSSAENLCNMRAASHSAPSEDAMSSDDSTPMSEVFLASVCDFEALKSFWRRLRCTPRKPAGRSCVRQMSSTVKVLAASAILCCVLDRVFTLSSAVFVRYQIAAFVICLIETVSKSLPRKPGLSLKACQSLISSE